MRRSIAQITATTRDGVIEQLFHQEYVRATQASLDGIVVPLNVQETAPIMDDVLSLVVTSTELE